MKRIAIIIKPGETSWETLRKLFLSKFGVDLLEKQKLETNDFYEVRN